MADWDALIHRHLEGTLDEEDARALEAGLQADPAVRRRLAEMAFETSQFRDLFAPPVPEPLVVVGPPEEASAPDAAPRHARWLSAAAAAAAVIALGVWLFLDRASYDVVEGRVEKKDGRLEVVGAAPAVLRLSDGSRAEFAPGSEASLRGPTADARQTVDLSRGSGRFAVAKAPGVFRVETPAGRVTVLGTEFTVELRKGRKRPLLAVAVVSGKVSVDHDGKPQVLETGQSRVFGEEKKPDPPRLVRVKVEGRVVSRVEGGVLFKVDRTVPLDREKDDPLAGRQIRLSAGRDGGEGADRLIPVWLAGLEPGRAETVDVRQLKGEVYEVAALDEGQVEEARRLNERRDRPKEPRKAARDGEKERKDERNREDR